MQAASPPPPAAAGSPPLKGNTAAVPKIGKSQPDAEIEIRNEPAAPATAEALPKCDIAACAAAYRTFTASDCTYMPSAGVRRLCTKGTPRPNAAAQTNAPAAPKIGTSQPDAEIKILNEPAIPATAEALPKCDIAACAAAYHSFTASDCTYMPSDGVRRVCTKGTPPQ